MAYVKDDLKRLGFHALPLERFRGNRFNILFSNAARVYFLAPYVQEYLQGGHQNRLLQSVKHDINVPEYLAGCKALGLVSELITKPLWGLIENKNVHVTIIRTDASDKAVCL